MVFSLQKHHGKFMVYYGKFHGLRAVNLDTFFLSGIVSCERQVITEVYVVYNKCSI